MQTTDGLAPLTRLRTGEIGAGPCYAAVALLTLVVVLGTLFRFEQPQAYHDYADKRVIAHVPFFWNVATNLPMAAVGVAGLVFLRRRRVPPAPGALVEASEVPAYAGFFAGAILAGLGSAYYHAWPQDATLVWDRLGMAVAFASLMVATLVDRGPPRMAAKLLTLTAAIALGSVLYWAASGNLTPYLAAQVGALAIVLAAVVAAPGRYTRRSDMYFALAFYALASTAEKLDEPVFDWTGGFVSGHTLKHLLAAIAMGIVYYMLTRRRVPA
jgi:hypothetical protein